ncbi:uracil-DNA glycosylase family protein [Streptomyces formicae]|uniref:SMUG2 DNA glycosylase family protein n=1 Tax=Streptomyces formicae TaxID=1616117 RepID=A0ABY3WKK0_9ACTN|nr:uracil-DNA glycosylase family protein [Streptomyces formicae]UNM13143.1 SMUG2 DNA glycosylase family protein [Streptomyces formicae]
MNGPVTVAHRILQFNEELAGTTLELPPGFTVINPFSGPQKERVREVTTAFYHKYYDDDKPRRLVLGSSPARRGTAVTGVPFEDAKLLESETGVDVNGYAVSRPSAGFLHDVISRYGGRDKFYADFVMSFVCPLGLVRTNPKGKEVNCNYYENKKLLELLHSFLVDTLKRQLAFGTDTSVCYCIGSGENFAFLSKVNEGERFFQRIVPLEHPRFITQYNRDREEEFAEKYLSAFRGQDD